MRKIWTSRKDKDKRKSLSGAQATNFGVRDGDRFSELESNTSIAELELDVDTLGGKTMVSNGKSGAASIKSDSGRDQGGVVTKMNAVNALVQPDYDQRTVKRSWVNVMVNSNHASEISEEKLRLCHAELRGSYMYLFKPNASIGVRSFRADDSSDKSDLSSSLHTKSDVFKHTNNSNITLDSNTATMVHSAPHTTLSSDHHNIDEEEDYIITHFYTSEPHPDLDQVSSQDNADDVGDEELEEKEQTSDASPSDVDLDANIGSPVNTTDNTLDNILTTNDSTPTTSSTQNSSTPPSFTNNTPVTSVEATIHFILFDSNNRNEKAVKEAIEVVPLFPKFGKVLKFICQFIDALASSKFEGEYSIITVWHRVLELLIHIKDNFLGFMLKPDVAPHILRLLELFTEILKDNDTELSYLSDFKTQMLAKQHFLLDLLNSDDVKPENPFQELNSTIFMKDINLIEFASTISFIDLKFFKSWNSNIDKSVLLQSSLNDPNNTENFYKKNPLLFSNNTHIHYISRLLINHLFIENSNFSSTSSLEKKARLIEKWIDLGCLLGKTGNMSSWLGIASIILSQPVLRLFKLWSLVSPDYIKLLRNDWTPVIFELETRNTIDTTQDMSSSLKESFHIMASRGLGKIYPKEKAVPYFGDLLINTNTSNLRDLESTWKKLNYSFNRWNEYLHNLKNYDEIIAYNDDVLRRYDSMGFIFSNESLNQVLYLGANSDESKFPPPRVGDVFESDVNTKSLNSSINLSIQHSLLKLIEVNCDSLSLEKIMRLSLILEPDLPEAYIDPLTTLSRINNSPVDGMKGNSGISLHSNESSSSLVNVGQQTRDDTSVNTSHIENSEFTPSSRIPEFNNQYFKINFQRYDELTEPTTSTKDVKNFDHISESHNISIDSNLTFRIDDFVSDLESSIVNTLANVVDVIDNVDEEEDVPGLGIDVDVILSSEKFNSVSLSPIPTEVSGENKKNPDVTEKVEKFRSYGDSIVSSDSRSDFVSNYRFIPKFATIDRLIDILLIDSRYFDSKITMDLSEYRFVFLLNYTSIISTGDLLDKLSDRFINSGNAVVSVMKKEHAEKNGLKFDTLEFPNWDTDDMVDLSELGKVNYELLLNIQINILKVLIILINDFYTSFALDLNNKFKMIKLLKLFNNEILQWYNSNNIDTNLESTFENWVNYYKKLKKVFVKKSYRPIEASRSEEYLISEFKFSSSLHEVPMNRNLPSHKNVNKIEKFLHKFNKLLTVFYKVIKSEDWIKIFKILEFEFEKGGLLEFNLQKPGVSEETLIISNIFNYFESLADPQDKQIVLMKFPLVFRKLFKLYFKFRSYLLIQLTDGQITAEERLDRMKTLLIMVKIAKFKMSDNQFVFEGTRENIPSCIESAITNVIYSPESRIFSSLWIRAAQVMNLDSPQASFDDLNQLLPKFIKQSDLLNPEPLLPCFGWIIENLIEANKCPSFYRHMINFNKRYLIYKIIKELVVEDIDGIDQDIGYHDSSEFDFLLKLDESLVQKPSFKSAIDREKPKFLRNVIKQQTRILILDNKKKQREEKDSIITVNPNLTKKASNSSIRRQSLSYKSSSNSRFKISGLFGKSKPIPERTINSKDLPSIENHIDAKNKPFAVISLKNKKIFPVYLLPFCFKVDSDNGSEDFFFQTLDQHDLNDWLLKLNFANRHWYFSKSLNVKGNNTCTTFGIPIAVVCKRENSSTPKFLEQIFGAIESEGLKDVGIYRIGSSLSELNSMKFTIDKYGSLDFNERSYDIHALTSVVKSYFRELPESLLTDEVIESFVEFKQSGIDELEQELKEYKRILQLLPNPNYQTLKKLLAHLRIVSEHSDDNKMTSSNIATVIGPALTEASNLEVLINNFGFMNSILGKLINHYDHIFDLDEFI